MMAELRKSIMIDAKVWDRRLALEPRLIPEHNGCRKYADAQAGLSKDFAFF